MVAVVIAKALSLDQVRNEYSILVAHALGDMSLMTGARFRNGAATTAYVAIHIATLRKFYTYRPTQRYHGDIHGSHGVDDWLRDGRLTGWDANKAAEKIRAIARSMSLTVTYTRHARDRMLERGLIIGDVLYVLKHGFVHLEPQASTRAGYFKYAMECRCPNGGNRAVRVVVIPENEGCFLKIATVMWVDEPETRSGSIIGEQNE